MELEKEPGRIGQLAEERGDENWDFRSFLKCYSPSEELDAYFHELY